MARILPVWVLVVTGALLTFLGACGNEKPPLAPSDPPPIPATVLALGDSYTVGHSLPTEWSWPYQLADSLAAEGATLDTLQIIARTGWTTRDLLDATRDSLADAPRQFQVVTLMIGVNNQFQGVGLDTFAAELDTLLARATSLAGNDPARVLAFSIPDYGLTPIGELFGSARVAREIAEHNEVLAAVAREHGVALLDITTLSELVAVEPALVSRDGLHYSREMYRRWVALMLPNVRTCLQLAQAEEMP